MIWKAKGTRSFASILGISTTVVEKNIRYLKDNGCIERIGSNKSGYWKVKD